MMNGYRKWTAMLLCTLLLCCIILPVGVRAEVVTISVYFSGMIETATGEPTYTQLEGSFRVYQNGREVGTLQAGKNTLTLNSIERIRLEPMPESIAPEWDLSTASVDVQPEAGGTFTVPIIVTLLSEEGLESETDLTLPENNGQEEEKEAPAPVAEETVEPAQGEGTEEEEGPSDAGDEASEEEKAFSVPDEETAAAEEEAETASGAAQITPVYAYTPETTPAPTDVPQLTALIPGDNTGSLRVCVFHDKNNNGELGLSEVPLSGITVYVLQDETETLVAAGESNEEGQVLVQGLEPGNYRIRVRAPEEWGFTDRRSATGLSLNCIGKTTAGEADSDAFTISAGQETERGVGINKMIHLSGMCWLDAEADGVYANGEQRMAGVRIVAEGQKNGLVYETLSDAEGNWLLDRVRPGFYTLTAYAPDGMMFTRYSKSGGNLRSIFSTEGLTKASRTVDTNDKESKENLNIGFMWGAKVTGRCYLDANYNGFYDPGEAPLAGVKVTAIKQVKDEEVAVTYSGEDGTFSLEGLRGNTYQIRAVLPDDGATFTRVVTYDLLGNHFQARDGRRENFWKDFILLDAETREIAIGAVYPASMTGTVYMDNDFSATRDGKEEIVSGFLVTLTDEKGGVVASDKTSVKGKYELTGIVPGNYQLKVTAVKGYAFTKLGVGNVIHNLSNGEGQSELFPVALGEQITDRDIGMILPATVSGTVFADMNDNGVREAEEAGLPGVVVRLMHNEEGEVFRTTIGEDGDFAFDAVMPGTYYLVYELPENAIFASVQENGNRLSGEGTTGEGDHFEISSGDEKKAALCGALTLGRLEGRVFSDPEADGKMNEQDTALDGATLELTPEREDLEPKTVTTAADGSFVFTDLHPGDYKLHLHLPEGRVLSRTKATKLPLTAGENDQTVALCVTMGQEWLEQQLGAVIPAALQGRVWLDENNDGGFDEGEHLPSGYRIEVTDETTGEIYRTLVTDEYGQFECTGMIPGSFTVSYTLDERTRGSKTGDSLFTEENGKLVLHDVFLAEEEVRDDLLLGVVKYTALSGNVWIDRAGAKESLSGAVITLKDTEGNTLQTATTGENGNYLFDLLMPGQYIIEGDMPAGCVVVEPQDERITSGIMTSIAEKTSGRHGTSGMIELSMGRDITGLDLGCVLPGRLGDLCWLDLNGNGLQDYNENGIPGVRIELLRNGEAVAETVSDQYGFYRFEEVYPAVYTLRVTAPAEVLPTVPREDIRLIASVLEESDSNTCFSREVVVQSGKANYNADLGFVCREQGVLPAGVGEGATQDWTSIRGSDN